MAGALGGAGRSVQTASIGLCSTGHHVQPGVGVAREALLTDQQRIVADAGGLRRVLRQPGRRRLFGDMQALPQGRVGLLGELQDVATVGEDSGGTGQHDGQPGAAGEAGQPGQAFGGGGDVFAQMLVSPRDDETIEALAHQLLPQRD